MSDTKALPQLKKSDFLAAIPDEPITRGKLVEALENFEFLSSWVDYLMEHFQAQGKIEVEGEGKDAVITRKTGGSSSSAPRDIFCVAIDEDGKYQLLAKSHTGNITDEDKENGWATTANAACKRMKSAIFAQYKEDTGTVGDLAESDPVRRDDVEEAEQAEDENDE